MERDVKHVGYLLLLQLSREVSRARGSQKTLGDCNCLWALQLWPWTSGISYSVLVWVCLPASNQQQVEPTHHGPAFQRESEGTWALKQSLLSLEPRRPKNLTPVQGTAGFSTSETCAIENGNLRSLILITRYWMLWTWVWSFSPSPSSSLEFSHQLLVFKISVLRQKVYWLQVEEAGHSGYFPYDLFIHNSLPPKGQSHVFIINQPQRITTIWKKC